MTESAVLFLQGPLGPFFKRLARTFSKAGYITHKINFNGGDRFFRGLMFKPITRVNPLTGPLFLSSTLLNIVLKPSFFWAIAVIITEQRSRSVMPWGFNFVSSKKAIYDLTPLPWKPVALTL